MSSQGEIQMKPLKLTPEQTLAALRKASENAKSWTVWKDTKAPQQAK